MGEAVETLDAVHFEPTKDLELDSAIEGTRSEDIIDCLRRARRCFNRKVSGRSRYCMICSHRSRGRSTASRSPVGCGRRAQISTIGVYRSSWGIARRRSDAGVGWKARRCRRHRPGHGEEKCTRKAMQHNRRRCSDSSSESSTSELRCLLTHGNWRRAQNHDAARWPALAGPAHSACAAANSQEARRLRLVLQGATTTRPLRGNQPAS